MSATTAIVTTIRPPPPAPWTARNAISCVMSCAAPHSTDPAKNSKIAACSTILRPYRSPSFPYTGPTTVEASR